MRCIAANIQQFSGNERSARCEIWSSEIPITQRWTLKHKGYLRMCISYLFILSSQHAPDRDRDAAKFHLHIMGTWPVSPLRSRMHLRMHSRHMIRTTYTVFIKAVWNKPLLGKGHSRSISPRRRSTSLGHQNED